MVNNKTIGIIGCGWLGIRLARHLGQNHRLVVTTTSDHKMNDLAEEGFNPVLANFSFPEGASVNFSQVTRPQVLIITIPFSKRTDRESLMSRFSNLITCIKQNRFEGQMFLMSSIGIYPDTEDLITEENVQEDLLEPHILLVEKLMKKEFPEINILRLGGLMGDNRFLSKYSIAPPLDKKVNHIHYKDVCGVVEKMIREKSFSRLFNVVSPVHPTKRQILEQQTGKTFTEEFDKAVSGKVVSPQKLEKDLSYVFQYPDPLYF
ncbi:Rossmann-fold NAD(P)-binding domain-containing protein [Chryseobacterium sp. CT-SW4]|uniref:epimerase n=1 Tax=Chryseobacterium sp. SW-1 TaxID=3157343 RepID=UPI003B0150C6